jgi:hypothetical protein
MIVELVTFKAPPGADWDDILKDARAGHFALARQSAFAAQTFPAVGWPRPRMTLRVCASVEKRTGAPPTIRYFQLQMLLDNEAGTVVEWSKTGER